MKLSKDLTNAEVANVFRLVSAIYAVKGENRFRITAYENAGNSIEQLAIPLKEVWQQGRLDEIPGIGEGIASHIDELFTTGTIVSFEKLFSTVPSGVFSLLPIPGIGPKTAFLLANTFHLTQENAVDRVIELAKQGELAKLPRFTPVREKKILTAVLASKTPREQRLLLPEAMQIAQDCIEYIQKCEHAMYVEALGSLRRRAPTVGDIDIAVATTNPIKVMEHLTSFPHIKRLVSMGEKMVIFTHTSGYQVDVKTSHPDRWGSMLQHYTGSKLHNIHLRTIAQEKGWSVSENGVLIDGKLKTFSDEASLYTTLGLSYIPPELREDKGEIQLAQKKRIPKLIDLADIHGDLHIHTNLSFPSSHDMGSSSIEDILLTAKEIGYTYIGLSDHNPKRTGLTSHQRLLAVKKRNDDIDEALERYFKGIKPAIRVYKGLEVDILPDGNLALEDDALHELDYCIASLHSQFAQDPDTVTKRLLKALSHPKVTILGHPTGRLLQKRDGADAHWDEVFSYCAKHKKILEINSSVDRTDLPSELIHVAKRKGCTFMINTDSHHARGLYSIQFGIWNARRGLCQASDVINTQPSVPF